MVFQQQYAQMVVTREPVFYLKSALVRQVIEQKPVIWVSSISLKIFMQTLLSSGLLLWGSLIEDKNLSQMGEGTWIELVRSCG